MHRIAIVLLLALAWVGPALPQARVELTAPAPQAATAADLDRLSLAPQLALQRLEQARAAACQANTATAECLHQTQALNAQRPALLGKKAWVDKHQADARRGVLAQRQKGVVVQPPPAANNCAQCHAGATATPAQDPIAPGLGSPGPRRTPSATGCFIATAAFGTPDAAEVVVLRRWRDRHLAGSPVGDRFIAAYYRLSPPIADYIAERPALKSVVRWGLRGVVFAVQRPASALLLVLGAAVAGLCLPLWRRRPIEPGRRWAPLALTVLVAGTALVGSRAAAQGRPPTATPAADALAGQGNTEFQRGRYAQALAAYQDAEARLPPGSDPLLRAELKYRQGRALYGLARYAEAQRAYQAALPPQRAMAGPAVIAATLHALADAQAAAGDAAVARATYLQALDQRRLAGDSAGEARTLINLAQLLADTGAYVEALARLDAATAAMARGGVANPLDRANLGNTLGLVQAYLGQYEPALRAFREAAAAYQGQPGQEGNLAQTLRNEAFIHLERGDYGRALGLFEQALAVLPSGPGLVLDRAMARNGMGYALVRLGRGAEAVAPLAEAVRALRGLAVPVELGRALESLGSAHLQTRDWPAALDAYLESLQIARHWRSPDDEREVLFSLGKLALAQGQVEGAIFELKQAVNVSQQLRAEAATLNLQGRTALANRLSEPYKLLARLLIDQGRVGEGERVLLAMKAQEYLDFVRGDDPEAAAAAVALTPQERAVADEINTLVAQQSRVFADIQAHLAGTSPLPEADYENLLARQTALNQRLLRALAAVDERLKAEGAPLLTERVSDSQLQEIVASLAQEPWRETSVALMYVPEMRVTTVVLTGPGGALVIQLPVGWETLDPLVRQLREAIRTKADYLAPARQLHSHLVAPVERELLAHQWVADTWMLFLTDRLRYLPFATLVGPDGRHVIETHRLALLTTPALRKVNLAPRADWSVDAFGSTQGVEGEGLGPLPAVREELRAIVRTPQNPGGLLPGQAALDAQFTRAAWLGVFSQGGGTAPRRNVLHVASHFKALAGDWKRSFLVLGGGELYNMSELASTLQGTLDHLDLVTLSACATEINDQGSGRELEGLGVLLQKRGARAVIGTLWEVQDAGTAALMQAFYRARGEHRRMSKAAALQAAQLQLLQGQVASGNPAVSLKHPHYWAPFILMGNWL